MPEAVTLTTTKPPAAGTPEWVAALGVVEQADGGQTGLADKVVRAKVDQAAVAAPAIGAAASAVKSVQTDDKVQLAADALKLSAETIAKNSAAAGHLEGSSQILTGINKALQGDAFGAASAASVAAEKLAPALAQSGVGALTSAVVIGTADDRLRDQARDVKLKVQQLVEPNASGSQRVKAALDLGVSVQGLANLARTLTLSGINILTFAVRQMGRSRVLSPTARSLTYVAKEMALTPWGRALGKLNRLMPLLNIAGVALSAKTAIDVFRAPGASGLSKALALASVGTSIGAFAAGFSLGTLPFLAIIAASIAVDLGLARSRAADAATAAPPALPPAKPTAPPLEPTASGYRPSPPPAGISRRPLSLVG